MRWKKSDKEFSQPPKERDLMLTTKMSHVPAIASGLLTEKC